MLKTQVDFLNLFFNPGETFCISPNKFGYHSISEMTNTMSLKSPNEQYAEQKVKEEEVLLMALNPINGFRNDDSVYKYRSFLVEVDFGNIVEQQEYIKSTKMPFSCCVYSGNKSLHYGIVLEQDLADQESWRYVAEWILNIMSKADQVTKNPSRSIRFPDNIRKDGLGKKQSLVKLNGRIKNSDLISWLGKHDEMRPIYSFRPERKKSDIADVSLLSGWLKKQLDYGLDFSIGRSNRWHSIAFDFGMAGFDYDDVEEFLERYFEPDSDFRRKEWSDTVKSGWKGSQRKI
jgi:hypothetical protein